MNAGTTTSGTTTSGTTNDDETMTFVEELEDGSTRVVRLDDDEEWDDDADDRRRSSASASALLERRVASSARAKNSAWSTTWTRVYDSARHASSFRGRGGMLERCAERGPVMMVISPRAGAEGSVRAYAGVFSPELPATPRHDFRGDDACAAFRVDASTNDVIDTTGTSTTPVYCAYGYTTRPNGVFGRPPRPHPPPPRADARTRASPRASPRPPSPPTSPTPREDDSIITTHA